MLSPPSPVRKPPSRIFSRTLSRTFSKTDAQKHDLVLCTDTATIGSGIAYFFAFVEHMTASAIAQGLPADQATRLAKQTCMGAGQMLKQSPEDASELRRKVTSPNGTTHAALVSFQELGLEDIVDKSMRACVARGEELGKN